MSRPRLPRALLGQASAVLEPPAEVGQNPLLRQRVLTEVRQAAASAVIGAPLCQKHMGVMLSLDRQRPVRGRRRQGQRERHPGDQARARTLAAVRRYDPPPSGRLLTRLARTVLARRGPVVAGPGAAAAAGRNGTAEGSSAPAA